jgi:hypothetical protein
LKPSHWQDRTFQHNKQGLMYKLYCGVVADQA